MSKPVCMRIESESRDILWVCPVAQWCYWDLLSIEPFVSVPGILQASCESCLSRGSHHISAQITQLKMHLVTRFRHTYVDDIGYVGCYI